MQSASPVGERGPRPNGRRRAFAVLGLALCAAGLAVLRSAFALPPPSGPLAVGTRDVPLLRSEPQPGRFVVQLWYPAVPARDRAPYGQPGPGLGRWVYHLLIRTHSARGAAIAAADAGFPVILYVAGWGGVRSENTALVEELASHGFVVAALDDAGHDIPPIPAFARAADFRSLDAYRATVRLGNQKLAYESARASDVLDRLNALDETAGNPLYHRLDLRRVGIAGFSFGGAVALETCKRDPRFKAAMNLDGWLFDAGSRYRGGVPYFLVSDRAPLPGPADVNAADAERRYTAQFTITDEGEQLGVLRHGGYALHIAGAHHLNFTDVPLYAPLHRLGGAHRDAAALGYEIRRYALAFFEHALNGRQSGLLAPGDRANPAMTLAAWPMRVRR